MSTATSKTISLCTMTVKRHPKVIYKGTLRHALLWIFLPSSCTVHSLGKSTEICRNQEARWWLCISQDTASYVEGSQQPSTHQPSANL
jgi:hypothetical protein